MVGDARVAARWRRVMKMIAGTSKGKKRNENERKHIGNSRKPATVNSHGRPRKPSNAKRAGAAMRHAMASAGHPPAASTIRFVGTGEEDQAAEHGHRQGDDDAGEHRAAPDLPC